MKRKTIIFIIVILVLVIVGLYVNSKIDWCKSEGELTAKCDAQMQGKYVLPF